MKKLLCIFLMACLVAPVIVTVFWLSYQKNLVRAEVRQMLLNGIEKEELALMKFSQHEMETLTYWEAEDEFKYDGRMYDVVQSSAHGDTTYIWCLPDEKETRLEHELNALLEDVLDKKPDKKDNSERLNDFYGSLFYSTLPGWQLALLPLQQYGLCFYLNNYSPPGHVPASPPPELV